MIHFNWDIKDLDHLTECLRQEYNHIADTPPKPLGNVYYNRTIDYLSQYEKNISLDAKKWGRTKLNLDDVSYHINNVGARGNWDIKNLTKEDFVIAVFGCSFTFGVGVPYKDTFPSIIANILSKKHPKLKLINLGFPGGSIAKTLKLYKYLTDCCKVDMAIFNFPTHWREELLVPDNRHTPTGEKIVNFAELIPNVSPEDDEYVKEKHKDFYSYTTNEIALYNNLKTISHIDIIGKYHNINNYYTSWDYDIYSLINTHYPDKTLPYFKFLENQRNSQSPYTGKNGHIYKHMGFGRDGIHPGVLSHGMFGDEASTHILKHQKELKKSTKPKFI